MASRTRVPALVAAAVLLGASTHAVSAVPAMAQGSPQWHASPSPTEPAPEGGTRSEGILLSPDELRELPTRGDAWEAIMSQIDGPSEGAYRLGARDDSNTDVLAHALAGARLEDDDLKDFVRDKIRRLVRLPRRENDILATLRNLQTYIVSADLIDLATFDPELDDRFRRWLEREIRATYAGGGGGGSVVSVHRTKTNNFGTHAGATRLAAALYLGDEEEFRAARDDWRGWTTGDPEYLPPDGLLWSDTDWHCDPDKPQGINPAGCTRDGHSLDGVIPEDQRRCGDFAWPPCRTTYIHGAADGLLLSFWMLARQGETPWEWGDRAALRQMRWKYDVGQPPPEGFRWHIPVIEAAYDIDLPGNDPAATSTNFGFADWWTQSALPPDDTLPPPWADRSPNPPGSSAVTTAVSTGLVVLAALVAYLAAVRWRRRRSSPRR